MEEDGRNLRKRTASSLKSLLYRKKTKKSNAEACREYRQRLKEDPKLYAQLREEDKKRCKVNRTKAKTEEQKSHERALARERARAYRQRKKQQCSANAPLIKKVSQPKTRQGKEEQRKEWRERKANQRKAWSGQKKRWHRQKCLARYYSKKAVVNSPPKRKRLPTAEEQASKEADVSANLENKLNSLKSKRSKQSIVHKKLFQSLLKQNVSPVKKTLYKKNPQPHVRVIKSFLNEQAIPIPDKRACTSTPKKILPKNLKRTHKEFRDKHPQYKVSLRTLYRHKPKHIITNTHATYRQCLCEICTNVDLKLDVLNKFCSNPLVEGGGDVLSERSVCEDLTLKCLERECSECSVETAIKSLGLPTVENMKSICKWKSWEMVDGENGKRRELIEKNGDVSILIQALSDDLKGLSKHLHTFRWQFFEYKSLKINLPVDTALAIFDFSENYLCQHQDEVQSAHWAYRQVTVHPCCLYYACPSCGDQVTDYLVCLSDDLTHDAHFVRKVTDIVKSHLIAKMRNVRKLVIFSDGCGAQYKSKMPFFFLAKDSGPIEVEKCFFGSRHGKSPCDSCGGIVKRLATRDVANGLVLIQNSAAMYTHMNQHHSLPREGQETTCSHTRRSFVLVNEVDRSIDSKLLKTVVGTQKLHQIKRVDNSTLKKRNLSCFCSGCLTEGVCEKAKFVLPWEFVTIPDLLQFTMASLEQILDRKEFFSEVQRQLCSLSSFNQFFELSNKISGLLSKFPLSWVDRFLEEEKCQVDRAALLLYPECLRISRLPIVTTADGNCLPRALSFLVFGDETCHVEMRCRISIALACNCDIFLDSSVWSLGSDPSDIIEFLCTISQFGPSPDRNNIIHKEAMLAIQNGTFMGLWQLFAASFVFQSPIESLYPNKGWLKYQQFCRRLISPPNPQPGHSVMTILWSSLLTDLLDEHWTPNHFVPFLPMSRPKPVQVVPPLSSPNVEIDAEPISKHSDTPIGKLLPVLNSFYKVSWGGGVYVAQVIDLSSDGYACIKFMKEKENLYFWGDKEDTSWEPFSIFIQEVNLHLDEGHSTHRKQWFTCSPVV